MGAADDKLMAAVLAAVNAYLHQEADEAPPARHSQWGYQGRVTATTQHLTWLRRPRP